MSDRFLADLVVLVHAAFILFVLFGGLLVLYRRWIAWLHLPAVAWAAAVEFFGLFCPLTPLENWLRRSADTDAYSTGFIEHYLLPIIYPAALTRELQLLLGALVLVINIAVYLTLYRHWRKDVENHG